MVSLFLRQCADAIHEIQRLLEIGETEGAGDVVFVDDFPVRPLRNLLINLFQFFALERRHTAFAWDTGFRCQGRHQKPPGKCYKKTSVARWKRSLSWRRTHTAGVLEQRLTTGDTEARRGKPTEERHNKPRRMPWYRAN